MKRKDGRKEGCGSFYILTKRVTKDGKIKLTINKNKCGWLDCVYCLKLARKKLVKEISKSRFKYFFTITVNVKNVGGVEAAYALLKSAKTKMIRRTFFKKNAWFMIFEFEGDNVHLHGVIRPLEELDELTFIKIVSKYNLDTYSGRATGLAVHFEDIVTDKTKKQIDKSRTKIAWYITKGYGKGAFDGFGKDNWYSRSKTFRKKLLKNSVTASSRKFKSRAKAEEFVDKSKKYKQDTDYSWKI